MMHSVDDGIEFTDPVTMHREDSSHSRSLSRSSSSSSSSMLLNADRPPIKRGIMEKQSRGIIKNWRRRFFILDRGMLAYYEPVHLYLQGQFDLTGYAAVDGYPSDTLQTIRLQSMHGPDICLRPSSMAERDEWLAALATHFAYGLRHADTPTAREDDALRMEAALSCAPNDSSSSRRMRQSQKLPAPLQGWLRKKGQVFPSVRRRFFVLAAGVLTYYSCDVAALLAAGAERLPRPKGQLCISGYDVYSDHSAAGRIELLLVPGKAAQERGCRRRLFLFFEDFMARKQWLAALQAHAAYHAHAPSAADGDTEVESV